MGWAFQPAGSGGFRVPGSLPPVQSRKVNSWEAFNTWRPQCLLELARAGENRVDELIVLLNRHSVRWLLIGGQAVRLEGMPRFSLDWDLYIPPRDTANLEKLNRLLSEEFDMPVEPLGAGVMPIPPSLSQSKKRSGACFPRPEARLPMGAGLTDWSILPKRREAGRTRPLESVRTFCPERPLTGGGVRTSRERRRPA